MRFLKCKFLKIVDTFVRYLVNEIKLSVFHRVGKKLKLILALKKRKKGQQKETSNFKILFPLGRLR